METTDRAGEAETLAPWLVLNHLSKSYGPVRALVDFSMTVRPR